jgi:hypothetical protein
MRGIDNDAAPIRCSVSECALGRQKDAVPAFIPMPERSSDLLYVNGWRLPFVIEYPGLSAKPIAPLEHA